MPDSHANSLLERLPAGARARLLKRCESIHFAQSDILHGPLSPTSHVYFPEGCFISLVASLDGKPCLEVGMVGSEGMLGSEVALGVPFAALYAVVQGAGTAWQLKASHFRAELENSKPLRELVDRYIYVLGCASAASAACVHFHLIGPRLASWMLMSQDRAHSSSFHVTHDFLAYIMGVRRGGVTAAAKGLQRRGFIAYSRGDVTIIDRKGLIAASCGCYAAGKENYSRVMH